MNGHPEPLVADSGNGGHLIYGIDLPPEDSGILKSVLQTLKAKFPCIDPKTFNPARITKAYGTAVRKGNGLGGRPHRESGILSRPDRLDAIEKEALLSLIGKPTKVQANGHDFLADMQAEKKRLEGQGSHPFAQFKGDLRTLDVQALWQSQGLEVYSGGSDRLAVQCPWHEEHTTGDSGVCVFLDSDSGYPTFACAHAHCQDRKMQDVLTKFGKDAVDAHCAKAYREQPQPKSVDTSGNHGTVVNLADPLQAARIMVAQRWTHEGCLTLRYRRRTWWSWNGTHYDELLDEVVKQGVYLWLEGAVEKVKDGKEWVEQPCKPNEKRVNDFMGALRAICQVETDDMLYRLGVLWTGT